MCQCIRVSHVYFKKRKREARKTALYLRPQPMYNQFKIPSAVSVRELYYIYRKTYDLGS